MCDEVVQPVEILRESSRNLLVLNRRKHRDDEADQRRSMKELRITAETVQSIANKLKTKSSINLSELQTLKNALIDDEGHIEVVLNTHGALRGLIRELTGNEVNKQCAAAGCCCNLALGDGRAAVAIVKSAGTYLVTALDNLTTELAVTSAWTLGNLAGASPKACELLTSQGAVTKLIELLESGNEEMRESALYALVRFAHQLKDELRTEHLYKIFEIIPRLDVSLTTQLLFILSCHKDFSSNLLSEQLLLKVLQHLVVSIQQSDQENVTHIFRFLANINSKDVFDVVLSFLVQNDMVSAINSLSKENDSVLWFLGNVFKLCSDHIFFEMLFR